ncbi:MAG TPA: transcriptional repressor [Dermatophilaceae bacterium]|nr:transcriptional repressor [Dermatophilaceae bacterium]
MTELAAAARAHGKRLTEPRRRIVAALERLGHGTPDAVAAAVGADGGAPLPASTIYRGLEALQQLGVVAHTHLDHRAPTYHLAGHADHVHLVCLGCDRVDEIPVEAAGDFAAVLREQRGFAADLSHMAIQGWCSVCRSQ